MSTHCPWRPEIASARPRPSRKDEVDALAMTDWDVCQLYCLQRCPASARYCRSAVDPSSVADCRSEVYARENHSGGQGMKGRIVVFTGPGAPFEIHEMDVPDPEPGAIILKVTQAGVC